MPLSELSERLLRLHAERPDKLFYGTQVLGGLFRPKDLDLLDASYTELAKAGLLEKSPVVVSYFGDPKSLYRITDQGAEHAAREPAA